MLTRVTIPGSIARMSEAETKEFLTRLWEIQAERGLKNSQLAAILGCSPSYIRHLKRGRPGRGKRLGLNIALAAAREFPDLSFLLVAEFPVSNYDRDSGEPEAHEGEQGQ